MPKRCDKKNNTVEILLHENLGGGFSPPAAHKIRRNGRKARNHGIDRTPYMSDRKMSYVSFHTRAISMGITKSESQTLMDAASKLKGILCVKRARPRFLWITLYASFELARRN